MAGLWLMVIAVLLIIFIAWAIKDPDITGLAVFMSIVLIVFITSVISNRNDSKTEVIKIKTFIIQSGLTGKDVPFELINKYNEQIVDWNEKGDNWYENKWCYHPSTQNLRYLK